MIVYEPPAVIRRIPVIDLANDTPDAPQARANVVADLHRACRETGFFYVVNHGVADVLMQRQLTFAKTFFDQPLDEKLKIDIRSSKIMRGYEAMGAQTLDEGSPPDLKEGLMLGREIGPDHWFVRKGVPFEGPNPWPENLPGFREQMTAYLDAMIVLGRRIAALLALSLDLSEAYFADGLEEPSVTVRLLRYPPHPDTARYNQLGSGAHTDWGLITLLLQDDRGGLEVKTAAGEWISATPIPGAFVVNLGDMVPRLTGGLYRSNYHRVMNNKSGKDRYSVPVFFNPNYFYEFDRVPTCGGHGDDTALVSFGEHVSQMFARTYGSAA